MLVLPTELESGWRYDSCQYDNQCTQPHRVNKDHFLTSASVGKVRFHLRVPVTTHEATLPPETAIRTSTTNSESLQQQTYPFYIQ